MRELMLAVTVDQVRQQLVQYSLVFEMEYLMSHAFIAAVEFESKTKSVTKIVAEFKRQNGVN